jgi:penicillin-binding protein 2
MSSNVYYYSLAHEMGVQAIHDFMKPLGFGQITGIDMLGEVRGVLPSPEWKRKTYKRPEQQKWLPGETVSLGIGQGYNNFSMLQMAHALATLVNGGTRIEPRLALRLQDPLTQALETPERAATVSLGLRAQNVEQVKSAMVGVTQEGTGRGVFAGAAYLSGGKTGTAQAVTIGQNQRYNARALDEHKRDHSLYIAFAPAENPVIAMAVVVENAGFGAVAAAPIARRVLDYWLLGQYPSQEDIAATQVGRSTAPIGQPRLAAQVPWPPKEAAFIAFAGEGGASPAQAERASSPPDPASAVGAASAVEAASAPSSASYVPSPAMRAMTALFAKRQP